MIGGFARGKKGFFKMKLSDKFTFNFSWRHNGFGFMFLFLWDTLYIQFLTVKIMVVKVKKFHMFSPPDVKWFQLLDQNYKQRRKSMKTNAEIMKRIARNCKLIEKYMANVAKQLKKVKLHMFIIIIMIFSSGCASLIHKPTADLPVWHIVLQVKIDNQWHDVDQDRNVKVKIVGFKYRKYKAMCRHNVILQRSVLEDYIYKDFRYVVGIIRNGQFVRLKNFTDYSEARKMPQDLNITSKIIMEMERIYTDN